MSLPPRGTWIPFSDLATALLRAEGGELDRLGVFVGNDTSKLSPEAQCLVVDLEPTEDEEQHPVARELGGHFVLGRSELKQVVLGTRRVLGTELTADQMFKAIARYIENDSFLFVGNDAPPSSDSDFASSLPLVQRIVARLASGDVTGLVEDGSSPWYAETELREHLGPGIEVAEDWTSGLHPEPLEGGGFTVEVPLQRVDGRSLFLAVDVVGNEVTIGGLEFA